TASSSTNASGYSVYRQNGTSGPWTKLNSSLVTGTSYTDSTASPGSTYTYTVHAVWSGPPLLESVDSNTHTVTLVPDAPTSVTLANGTGVGSAYISTTNQSSLNVNVALPGTSISTETVTLTLGDGAGHTVTATKSATSGAGTVSFTGLNASTLNNGTATLSAT